MRLNTWLANAQKRSARRKSGWNLLLLLIQFSLFISLWFALVEVGCLSHFVLHHEVIPPWTEWMHIFNEAKAFPRLLMVWPPMLPAVVGSMVISNFVIHLIPQARRALDSESRDHPGTEYATAQASLSRLGVYSALVAVVLMLAGAWWL